jgi:PAS domain S-box-containing protein
MKKQSEGIWIIDSAARTAYVNDRMAEILGVPPSEMLGQDSLHYVFPEDLDNARRLFQGKKSGDTSPFRFRLRRPDGVGVWVSVQGTPMYDSAGVFTGIVGTFSVSE